MNIPFYVTFETCFASHGKKLEYRMLFNAIPLDIKQTQTKPNVSLCPL